MGRRTDENGFLILDDEDYILDAEEPDVLSDLDEVFGDEEIFDGEEDIVLEFVDDDSEDTDFAAVEKRVTDLLGEFEFEEILVLNEIDTVEAMSHLYYSGIIGLPVSIENDEDSEAEQDLQETEDEE